MSVPSTARLPGKSRSEIMTERTPPPLAVDPETRRAASARCARRRLADGPAGPAGSAAHRRRRRDPETSRARRGMGENTLRAWPRTSPISRHGPFAATGAPLHWPAAETALLKNTAKREAQRKHGMPQNVAESLREDRLLRSENPHAPATARRRLSSWPPHIAGAGSRGHSPPLP